MTFGLAMSKKLTVGQYIGVGDQFSMTSDTYLRFDDTDAQKVIAFKSSYSGTYERPLGVYTLTQAGEYSAHSIRSQSAVLQAAIQALILL